jgi:large subunit ribosomal protein L10
VNLAQKRESVAALNQALTGAGVVVVAHYSGLSVAQMSDLRRQMRAAGGTVKVAKNRLAKRALEGTDVAHLGSLLRGPTVLVYSPDAVAAPKVATEFAKANENLVILGGAMGATSLDANGIKALAALPSLDELRGKLVGLVQAPAAKLARLSNAPAGKLARVFGAYAHRDEAA